MKFLAYSNFLINTKYSLYLLSDILLKLGVWALKTLLWKTMLSFKYVYGVAK